MSNVLNHTYCIMSDQLPLPPIQQALLMGFPHMPPIVNVELSYGPWEAYQETHVLASPWDEATSEGEALTSYLREHGCKIAYGQWHIITFPPGTQRQEGLPRTAEYRYRVRLPDGACLGQHCAVGKPGVFIFYACHGENEG